MLPRYSRIFLSSGLAFLCAVGAADINAATNTSAISRVRLVATLNGQPALQEANWTIFSVNDQRHPAATLPRHSGTVFLSAGQYRATVRLDGITKQTSFRVESETENIVKVAMDHASG